MSEHGHGHDHDGEGHDHDHGDHGHSHDHTGGSQRALLIALLINTAFFVVELAGALYANSLTLLADAAHMLTDSGSLALALLAAYVARRAADRLRTYGYQRVEILGALVNGVVLLAIVVYVAYEAVLRLGNPEPIKPLPTVAVGLVGLLANLAGAYVLHGGTENLNVRGAYLHLLADAAGSLAAVVLGVALYVTDLYALDAVFSLLIAALVLYSAKDLLRDSVNVLLQGAPSDVPVDEVADALAGIDASATSTTSTSGCSPPGSTPAAPTSSSNPTPTATPSSNAPGTSSARDTASTTPPSKSRPRSANAPAPNSTATPPATTDARSVIRRTRSDAPRAVAIAPGLPPRTRTSRPPVSPRRPPRCASPRSYR
ncbi:cobalt-zinc-cadmium resistance protein CzcD [Halarchaeum acidiphilum MH1-52-1]|uniref:Cobalt-zinc-cadmium resistance protein CzcD n=1 Tax=Halarchaeum acidiphilum MH1-52-1 TaxID=1261545 RepID=U2YCH7_9EURY|nr:cation diffusion facilitator family transporter [Halarchaeum acidiphilum]GAD51291.1 cobalt-zinc-cadmium resistance protein CzcD [Halarchaeum acidiphilum MH1-52-1]